GHRCPPLREPRVRAPGRRDRRPRDAPPGHAGFRPRRGGARHRDRAVDRPRRAARRGRGAPGRERLGPMTIPLPPVPPAPREDAEAAAAPAKPPSWWRRNTLALVALVVLLPATAIAVGWQEWYQFF